MKYRVTISVGLTFDEIVEAEDELEAENKATELAINEFTSKNIDDVQFLVDDIEELDEEISNSDKNIKTK